MTDKDTNEAQLIAGNASIALNGRNLIGLADRTSYSDVCATLGALHENFATLGGSAMLLADMHGCKDDVARRIAESFNRFSAARACTGLGGTA